MRSSSLNTRGGPVVAAEKQDLAGQEHKSERLRLLAELPLHPQPLRQSQPEVPAA